MTQRTCVLLALLFAFAVPLRAESKQAAPTKDEVPPGYTKVTGADLPQWRIWRSAFRGLARPDGDGESNWLPGSISVAPSQLTLILRTARRCAAAEAEMTKRQQAKLAEMQAAGLKWKDIKPALYELDYEQRVSTLAERDALLLQLAPDARQALEAWVEESRTGAVTFVPIIDIENWRRPS